MRDGRLVRHCASTVEARDDLSLTKTGAPATLPAAKWIFDYDNPPDYRSFLSSSICSHNFYYYFSPSEKELFIFEGISERHSSSKSSRKSFYVYRSIEYRKFESFELTRSKYSSDRKIETSLCQELTIKRCDRSFKTRIGLESVGIVEESWGSREQRAHEVERGG